MSKLLGSVCVVLFLMFFSGCSLSLEPPTRLQRADPTINTHRDVSKPYFDFLDYVRGEIRG